MDPGGTANLAVLGGNLPPSSGTTDGRVEGHAALDGGAQQVVDGAAVARR